jgi:hypothetical protein
MSRTIRSTFAVSVARLSLTLLSLTLGSYAADSATAPQVHLDVSKTSPRQVEELTEKGILRDYRLAWSSLAQALELNTLGPLDGPFAGEAKRTLRQSVLGQQHAGLSTRYIGQTHQVEGVLYSPEGDVMELHDTAQYQLQITDGGKVIHDERVLMHYVVLMTPAADRWVIRQLQAVPNF